MKTIMKITLLFTFAFYLLPFSFLFGQDTWTKTYNPFCEEYVPGMGWIELEVDYEVEDVLVTQDGGYVVSGSFDRWIDDDPPFWFDHWGFLMKTDCDGNLLWAKGDSVDFLGENDNYAFVETNDGSFISVGYCFGGSYMIKRDSEGNRLWAVTYSDFGVNSMCKTLDGNIALGGRLFANAALRKMDNNGNTIWTKSYEIGTGSNAYSVCRASDGGYLLTGINYTNNDILTIKTDANGDMLWTYTFEGLGYNDKGNCVVETNDGNYIVVGRLRFISNYGGVIIEYNTNGDTLWTKVEPSAINNNFYSVVSIEDGIVSYGTGNSILTNLYKYNCEGDSIWFHSMPKFSGYGDRCLQNLPETGFIVAGALHSYTSPEVIHLTKTDENGNVPVDDYEIIHFNDLNLNCYPNPFSISATISFNCSTHINAQSRIVIYNIKGQKIRELEVENNVLGIHEIIWDGKSFDGEEVQNGIYFLKLESDNYRAVKKVIKIK